jgi:hypothetical protein
MIAEQPIIDGLKKFVCMISIFAQCSKPDSSNLVETSKKSANNVIHYKLIVKKVLNY